jgi:hypothetical protein
MTTITQQFNEINKQQNTLNIILQLIARVDPAQFYVTNSTTNYDVTRIDTIRSYLQVEQTAVETILNDLLNCNTSGC